MTTLEAPTFWPTPSQWMSLTPVQQRELEQRLYDHLGLRLRYTPFFPHPKQGVFLTVLNRYREVFYGGAAGGAKSTALLMAALQYVDVPGYSAILFRRTYSDLALPGALMDKADEWLGQTDARFNTAKHQWRFPSGATLQFGYLEREASKRRYQSAEFQFIGFDELTDFTSTQYRYLFSRLRRPLNAAYYGTADDGHSLENIPLRMRSASNPGGPGHQWVKQRLVREDRKRTRIYLRSRIEDNPSLDEAEYAQSLEEMTLLEQMQLMRGDWDAATEGTQFRRSDIIRQTIPRGSVDVDQRVRSWDLAATEPNSDNDDPDYTVGLLLGRRVDGKGFVVEDVTRFRRGPGDVEDIIEETADEVDGPTVSIRLTEEPGSSGKLASNAMLDRLLGYDADAKRETGPKEVRARPAAAMLSRSRLWFYEDHWLDDFTDEAADFPGGDHDDQIDALSQAVEYLRENRPGTISETTGTISEGYLP